MNGDGCSGRGGPFGGFFAFEEEVDEPGGVAVLDELGDGFAFELQSVVDTAMSGSGDDVDGFGDGGVKAASFGECLLFGKRADQT